MNTADSVYGFAPQISVLLPTYNGERYLTACLESVLQQRFDSFEVLVVDDASRDSSFQIIQKLSDARVRYFRREQNQGLFATLNQLVSLAQAPLVRFLGQDDILEPNCLEREVDFFRRHATIGMSYCKYLTIDENDKVTGGSPIGDLPDIIPPALSLQYFYYLGCLPGNISSVCVRRACLSEVGLFEPGFQVAGDYEMWTRVCRRWDLGVIHERLLRLRLHAGQLSRAIGSGVPYVAEHRRVQQALLPLLPEENRAHARSYFVRRQNVLDVHFALRCLLAGRPGDLRRVLAIVGPRDFALGLVFWLLTANNHLFRPRLGFVEELPRGS